MNAIRPRQPVIVAALPMPVSGLALLSDVVERLYGTGESTVSYSGDGLTIFAPRDGFGPRKTNSIEPAHDDGDGVLREADTAGDELTLTFEQSQATVGGFGAALARYFEDAGGINYVTAQVVAPGQQVSDFHVTVQRADRPSAHELRQVAEERVALLEQQLRELGEEPRRA
jgi:hypothetical protein